MSERERLGATRRARRDQVAGLAPVEERADALAHAAVLLGGADRLGDLLEMYPAVGADDLRRVAEEYLLRPAGVATLTVVPRDPAMSGEEGE